MLNNVKYIVGSKVLYVRADNVVSSTNPYIMYGKTKETMNTKCSNFWNATFLYQNILWCENLQPSSEYYFKVYATISGKLEASDTIHIYTSDEGKINLVYANKKNQDGICYVTNSKSQQVDWTSEFERALEVCNKAVQYYQEAGYFPPCKITVAYATDMENGTAAMSSAGTMMLCNLNYINTATIIHEFSHFMDYDYAAGLSDFGYLENNAFGSILGAKMKEFCQFWLNYEEAATAGHRTHCFPFSDYSSNYNYENTDFQIQLHKVAAMFNIFKGYDGLIGISNIDIVTPYYSLEPGNYTIKGFKSNMYLCDSGSILSKTKDTSDAIIWTVSYRPSSTMYTILNKATGKYINIGTAILSDTAKNMLINKSIYTTKTGTPTYSLILYLTSIPADSTNSIFTKNRKTLKDVNIDIEYDSTFNPRLKNHGYIFSKV